MPLKNFRELPEALFFLISSALQSSDYDEKQLAERLHQSLATVRTWRCRAPHRLPPGIKIGRKWLYNRQQVEDWLSHAAESNHLPTATEFQKKRGRPPGKSRLVVKAKKVSCNEKKSTRGGK